jgi:hypothetical protein
MSFPLSTFSLIILSKDNQAINIEVICCAYLFVAIDASQGVTKRCRPFVTSSALVYSSPNAGGWGVAGSQPMSKAVFIT